MYVVDRETLMLLPESVLLGMFPHGLILSKPASWEGADDGVFTVDVSDPCPLTRKIEADECAGPPFPVCPPVDIVE